MALYDQQFSVKGTKIKIKFQLFFTNNKQDIKHTLVLAKPARSLFKELSFQTKLTNQMPSAFDTIELPSTKLN